MEVRPGYKQTEIGVIPTEWNVTRLGDCLKARPSYGINAAAVPYSDRLPAYVRITDISDDGHFSPAPLVSVRSEMSHEYILADGDIVFARTGASVGKSYRYNPNDGVLVYAGFLIRVTPDPEKLLTTFAAAFATTGSYWRWVRLMSMRSGQPGINGNEYAQLPIPLPPVHEQCAIAAALGDVDALLVGLDRLIAKKRDLKQAAMQQLLTGQTRLPGFSTGWAEKSIAEIAPMQRGFDLPSHELSPGPYPVVYSNGILNSHANAAVLGPGVVTGRSGTIGRVTFVGEPYWPHNTALWVTSFNGNSPRFVYYLYTFIDFARFASGSGVPTLNRADVHAFRATVPVEAGEQEAIVSVLSDMDAELAALEARRDKTRALKQGMMQELLTGRTRLV